MMVVWAVSVASVKTLEKIAVTDRSVLRRQRAGGGGPTARPTPLLEARPGTWASREGHNGVDGKISLVSKHLVRWKHQALTPHP